MEGKFKRLEDQFQGKYSTENSVNDALESIISKACQHKRWKRTQKQHSNNTVRQVLKQDEQTFQQAFQQSPVYKSLQQDTITTRLISENHRPLSARIDRQVKFDPRQQSSKSKKRVSSPWLLSRNSIKLNLQESLPRKELPMHNKSKFKSESSGDFRKSFQKLDHHDEQSCEQELQTYLDLLRKSKQQAELIGQEKEDFCRGIKAQKQNYPKMQRKFQQQFQNKNYFYSPTGDVLQMPMKTIRKIATAKILKRTDRYSKQSQKQLATLKTNNNSIQIEVGFLGRDLNRRITLEQFEMENQFPLFVESKNCKYFVVGQKASQ